MPMMRTGEMLQSVASDRTRRENVPRHISDTVHFMGEVREDELLRQYAMCDVLVLPSIAKSEAFALVQIEAMAFGKPVINTNLPSGVPYVSVDKVTGLTVKPGDVQSLAKAMQWMEAHKEERVKMGEAARQRMKEEYRMEKMLERVYNVYNEAFKQSS